MTGPAPSRGTDPAAQEARRTASQVTTHGHLLGWAAAAAGVLCIVAGFAGADGWVHQHVSLVLNTEDRPLDRDFYQVTKPFWLFWRYAFGHVLGALGLGVVALILRPRRWPQVLAGALAVTAAALLANLAQGAIGRVRPNQAHDHLAFAPPLSQLFTKDAVSFPSGEAATAFALAWVMTRLFPRWRAAFYAAAVAASAARLVNGAHYLSDLAAGALLGTALAAGVHWAADRGLRRFETLEHPQPTAAGKPPSNGAV